MLTPEQQAIRQKGIGASEIAAVAGLSPWAKPIDIYLRKLGMGEAIDSHHIDRGNFLEPAIIKWYAHKYKRTVESSPTLQHPKHPIVIATPDAISTDEHGVRRVVEVKAPGFRTAREWGPAESDGVPDYYRCQVMWQMAATGLKEAEVVAFIDGDIQRYTVPWHQEFFDLMLRMAEEFWESHVVRRRPPDADGSTNYSEFNAQRFPESIGTAFEDNTDETAEWAEMYGDACDKLKEIDDKKRLARQKLEAVIGTRQGIYGYWGKIHWRTVKSGERTDWQAVAKSLDAPESIIAQHTRIAKGYRSFKTYIGK